jgi:hypothetical protein
MMDNPYLITGPALISFSGGRTSAYMLHQILAAHGGQLPPDVHVTFAKEREETLRFVHECGSRWGVQVVWVQWTPRKPWFEEVGLNSAARNGEPFDTLIERKQRLPNGQEKSCTQNLKVVPIQALMRALGHGEPGDYGEIIGLRFDEGHRILKGLARAAKDKRCVSYPLADTRQTKRDVRRFWFGSEDARYETSARPQGFDLELPELWGNCDLCFEMGVEIRRERIRQRPEIASWWAAAEARTGGTFSKRESIQDLVRQADGHSATPDLFDEQGGECGDVCGGDTPAEIAALQREFERGGR